MEIIKDTLQYLGITQRYCGYGESLAACRLIIEDWARLDAIVKEVYMEVAEDAGKEWSAVERNIRTAAHRAWTIAPQRLQETARYPLSSAPAAGEFLAILCNYAVRSAGCR